jgi:hypothetical protein
MLVTLPMPDPGRESDAESPVRAGPQTKPPLPTAPVWEHTDADLALAFWLQRA